MTGPLMHRSIPRKVLGTTALALLVLAAFGVAGWRFFYVTWKIRSAQETLRFGDADRMQGLLRDLERVKGIERPDRPELLYLLGRVSRRAGELDEALTYLRRAERAGWPGKEIRQQYDLLLIQRGRFEETESRLKKLLRESVSDELAYEVYEALAKGYMHAYRFSDALHCLNFWIEWCPQATDPRMWRAEIWERVERWSHANDEYKEVLRIAPKHRKARIALAGNLLLKANEVEAARLEFVRCLEHHPEDVDAILGLAMCERRLADPQSAEQRLRSLLTRDLRTEEPSAIKLELGSILVENRKLPEAIQLLLDVIKEDPQNSTAHHTLGLAYAASRQREAAQHYFERSQTLTEQYGRLVEITAELVTHPERADLRLEAGKILFDQGLEYEGAAWMASVLMFDPHHQKAHEALARYYQNVKHDARLAKHHFQQARAAGGDL